MDCIWLLWITEIIFETKQNNMDLECFATLGTRLRNEPVVLFTDLEHLAALKDKKSCETQGDLQILGGFRRGRSLYEICHMR